MDKTGAYNLIIALVKQAAAEYRRAYKRHDTQTCNLIDTQIRRNNLVISAGFSDVWSYITNEITRG